MPDPEQGDDASDCNEVVNGVKNRPCDRLSGRGFRDRTLPFLKLQFGSAGRRPRRAFHLILLVLGIFFWICLLNPLWLEHMKPITTWSGNSASLGRITSDHTPAFRQRLWRCLSFNGCPWSDSGPTRAQVLEADKEYLDPEHLRLKRMDDPYPDINKWSTEKKERSLRGLDWLQENYLERWRPDLPHMNARNLNIKMFVRLRECLQVSMTSTTKACPREEMTVILLGSYWFGTVHTGLVAGENIWARSIIDAFDELGYSTLYAFQMAEVYEIHRAIPDLIHLVIADAGGVRACHEFGKPESLQILSEEEIEKGALVVYIEAKGHGSPRIKNYTLAEWTMAKDEKNIDLAQPPVFYGSLPLHGRRFGRFTPKVGISSPPMMPDHEWRCTQAPDFPQGIPLWKMLGFTFWTPTDLHPLGPQWTMSPEPYATFPGISWKKEFNMYTGYSIEAYCGKVVPPEERKHRAYILAKRPAYLFEDTFALTSDVFDDISRHSDITFIAGIGETNSSLPIPGITNIGYQSIPGFLHEMGSSKALVGVGRPWISPTPYDALCMGVPFINPIMRWDKTNPDDRSQWNPQHEGLSDFGEPWVYNVKKGNETEIKNAIAKAIATPIEPFIPRRMTRAAMRARHRLLVETDWKAMYEESFAGNPV